MGDSSEDCKRSGTESGFSFPFSLLNDACAMGADSEVVVGSGGAVVLVGVLGPPILESSCLS